MSKLPGVASITNSESLASNARSSARLQSRRLDNARRASAAFRKRGRLVPRAWAAASPLRVITPSYALPPAREQDLAVRPGRVLGGARRTNHQSGRRSAINALPALRQLPRYHRPAWTGYPPEARDHPQICSFYAGGLCTLSDGGDDPGCCEDHRCSARMANQALWGRPDGPMPAVCSRDATKR